MAARLQLRDVWIALRIVDELMMGEMLQPIMMRAAVNGKHAAEVGGEIVEPAIAEQDVMGAFVGEAA